MHDAHNVPCIQCPFDLFKKQIPFSLFKQNINSNERIIEQHAILS